jgi:hypothetical protein
MEEDPREGVAVYDDDDDEERRDAMMRESECRLAKIHTHFARKEMRIFAPNLRTR